MRITPDIPLYLSDLSKALDLPIPNEDNKICAFTTDSREIIRGDVFIALNGDCDSGEKYVSEAKKKGAYVISRNPLSADFLVEDTENAILRITEFYRAKFINFKACIAVTGSVGKTTTKNIISDILSIHFKVHKTHGNYNNYLGLFHTVLTMPKETEILVCELGMNHKGEISALSKAVIPTVCVITNIGNAHVGNLGSREETAKAKLEITDGMQKKLLIVPYEEKLLECSYQRLTVSISDRNADCFIRAINLYEDFSIIDLVTENYHIEQLKVPLPGAHILPAVGFAALISDMLGLSKEELSNAITSLSQRSIGGKFIKIGKLTFYDDSYSSSPEALIADFELMALRKNKRISCVLGDMLELGSESKRLHEYIGHKVAQYGFDKLFTFGRLAEDIAKGAIDGGMCISRVFKNSDINAPEITARQISLMCDEDEIILCKASHATDAGRILKLLK